MGPYFGQGVPTLATHKYSLESFLFYGRFVVALFIPLLYLSKYILGTQYGTRNGLIFEDYVLLYKKNYAFFWAPFLVPLFCPLLGSVFSFTFGVESTLWGVTLVRPVLGTQNKALNSPEFFY